MFQNHPKKLICILIAKIMFNQCWFSSLKIQILFQRFFTSEKLLQSACIIIPLLWLISNCNTMLRSIRSIIWFILGPIKVFWWLSIWQELKSKRKTENTIISDLINVIIVTNFVTASNVTEKKNQLTVPQRSDQLLQSRMISWIGLVWLIHKVHDFQCNSLVQPILHCFSNKTQQQHQNPLQCYWSGSTFPWLTEVGSNPLGTCKQALDTL